MTRTHRPIGLAAALAIAIALAGCGAEAGPAVAVSTGRPTPTPSPSPSTSPSPSDRDGDGIPDHSDPYPDDPKNIPKQSVTVHCNVPADSFLHTFVIHSDQTGKPDFTAIWAAKATSCEVGGSVLPVTDFEKAALKTPGYKANDLTKLYQTCVEVDPDAANLGYEDALIESQVAEIKAALALCPKHPLAAKYRQAIKPIEADLKLKAQGRLFDDGTYLVGKEIRPGTYYTTDVRNCYWERQNRSGGIISNDFIISARRAQVTIRSSDYGFYTEGCGTWRPVR
ncbi:MAG TPA: hypothetical protein VFX60_08755 [Micromonospora sp.]|nr:hypothetical protein [Micromonospora sp.]